MQPKFNRNNIIVKLLNKKNSTTKLNRYSISSRKLGSILQVFFWSSEVINIQNNLKTKGMYNSQRDSPVLK